ncbi:MAG: aminopeptidase [Spirochaetales bacterium]|nr:aminopeptidase [Spirochaetales bacterium]
MFDGRIYYAKENKAIDREYGESLTALTGLLREDFPGLSSPFREFIRTDCEWLLRLCDHEKKASPEYFLSRPLEELRRENRSFFGEIESGAYERSYANPSWCVSVFGEELGQLMSFFHVANRQHVRYASRHERFEMLETHRTFLAAYEHLRGGRPDPGVLGEILTARHRRDRTPEFVRELKEGLSLEYDLAGGIWDEAGDDPRALFIHGMRVSDVEIETARFIGSLPPRDVDAVARSAAAGYARGFEVENKDRTARTVCGIWGSLGQERIYRSLIARLKEEGFDAALKYLSAQPVNRQYYFDHQFDVALYLSEELAGRRETEYQAALDACAGLCGAYSGDVYFEAFGEKPFTPVLKRENVKLSPDQQRLLAEHRRRMAERRACALPRARTSFTAVAFPCAEIGDRFEEIFREMIAVNTLDAVKYEAVQKTIIDALDAASSVRIIGKGANKTNLTVRLHRLDHPERETNFVNCGADINIPLGEVFTSPQLTGTNGTLHVGEAFLFDRFFRDLRLDFTDGMVTGYGCANYPTGEENRHYIEENLLFPHKTLPLGEFAIGTNTLAFAMSRRFGILDRMPVLIIEKMGPHFAVGDTCFSHEEDHPSFNVIDGKRIVAKENEKTSLRKTDPASAYTDTHVDITLPYGEVGRIAAVRADGREIDIIRDGRFVLPGTEALNEPLEELDGPP